MKLEATDNYCAYITTVTVSDHPNADRLKLASGPGFDTVAVGVGVNTGDVMVYFPAGTQLSKKYAESNDLIRRQDESGNNIGGMFDNNRKVRIQKIRGIPSDGYLAPVSSLRCYEVDINKFTPGLKFNTINGEIVCSKFISKATRANIAENKSGLKKENELFLEHVETRQFRYEVDMIPAGSILTITLKMHGTSARHSNVWEMEQKPERFTQRLKWRLTKREPRLVPVKLVGSRRTIIGTDKDIISENEGWYGTHSFRYKVWSSHVDSMSSGELIYGEIVGWVDELRPVMGTHSSTKLKDKEIKKQYGETITYTYGCEPGETEFYVYRIAKIGVDGDLVELSWPQVKRRARHLGIRTVPEMTQQFVYDGNKDSLVNLVASLCQGPDPLDPRHPIEGVVVRIDRPDGTTAWVKEKSVLFKLLEGILQEDESSVDIEESS